MANKENIIVIERLMDHYNVYKLNQLAEKMNIKYDSICSWKNAATLNPLKNICRELNIYNEIFSNPIIPLEQNVSNNFDDKKHLSIDTISFENKELKRLIKNWGIQGYGIAVALIVYLKENTILEQKQLSGFADDLKVPVYLVNKIIEDCNIFALERNSIRIKDDDSEDFE